MKTLVLSNFSEAQQLMSERKKERAINWQQKDYRHKTQIASYTRKEHETENPVRVCSLLLEGFYSFKTP